MIWHYTVIMAGDTKIIVSLLLLSQLTHNYEFKQDDKQEKNVFSYYYQDNVQAIWLIIRNN